MIRIMTWIHVHADTLFKQHYAMINIMVPYWLKLRYPQLVFMTDTRTKMQVNMLHESLYHIKG